MEEHGKQLINYSGEKSYPTILKQKYIFNQLTNKMMTEIQSLSKQIDFNNRIDFFKKQNWSKVLLVLKVR